MTLYEEASFIVEKLSLEEKCKFCCGIDFWESFSKDELIRIEKKLKKEFPNVKVRGL